jgi:hypothetical protein
MIYSWLEKHLPPSPLRVATLAIRGAQLGTYAYTYIYRRTHSAPFIERGRGKRVCTVCDVGMKWIDAGMSLDPVVTTTVQFRDRNKRLSPSDRDAARPPSATIIMTVQQLPAVCASLFYYPTLSGTSTQRCLSRWLVIVGWSSRTATTSERGTAERGGGDSEMKRKSSDDDESHWRCILA